MSKDYSSAFINALATENEEMRKAIGDLRHLVQNLSRAQSELETEKQHLINRIQVAPANNFDDRVARLEEENRRLEADNARLSDSLNAARLFHPILVEREAQVRVIAEVLGFEWDPQAYEAKRIRGGVGNGKHRRD